MPAVIRGDDQFAVVTYTGTGASQSITGLRFQPDFVWIKGRSGATDHALYDRVRGVQLDLVSNSTAAETTQSTGLTAFNADGFTIGSLAKVNTNGATYVAWCWKANGAGVSNTAGSITSTVSANTAAGISIVTYSGVNTSPNTVGHGLGAVPKFWLIKNRSSSSGNWVFNYVLNGVVYYMFLNSTAAANAQGSPWSTLPSSSVVTLGGNDANTCQSGSNYVMYAFAEVAGFSKFGSYTGNGSTDGPFVYCGFRPRWILVKRTDTAGTGWAIYDTSRDSYNVEQQYLGPESSAAESALTFADGLSNGFKLRTVTGSFNASGGTYIFAAFAEAAFNFSRAR